MLNKATFKRGGVHPDDMKRLTKDKAVERLPMPGELYVSMSQHLGAPATPLKAKGDRVEKGEVVGKASSFISADVHSPVSGSVVDVRKVRLATGANADTLVIKPDEEQPDSFKKVYDWKKGDGHRRYGRCNIPDKRQVLCPNRKKGGVSCHQWCRVRTIHYL